MKMAEKSQNADSGKKIKEKKINKKENTTQQQKGLPTLSADLNNNNKTASISSFIFLCIVKRDNSYCLCVCFSYDDT